MRLTWWIAGVLASVAAAGIASWFTAPGLRSWAPSVVVAATSSALTITVIDGAVHREASRRVRPRIDSAYSLITGRFQSLLIMIVVEFGRRHANRSQPIPTSVISLIDRLLAEEALIDRRDVRDEPLVFREAETFAYALETIRERDRDILEPDLINAMDGFSLTARGSIKLLRFARERNVAAGFMTPERTLRRVLEATREFVVVFGRYVPSAKEIPQGVLHPARARTRTPYDRER